LVDLGRLSRSTIKVDIIVKKADVVISQCTHFHTRYLEYANYNLTVMIPVVLAAKSIPNSLTKSLLCHIHVNKHLPFQGKRCSATHMNDAGIIERQPFLKTCTIHSELEPDHPWRFFELEVFESQNFKYLAKN
jgi:hypothetical protein